MAVRLTWAAPLMGRPSLPNLSGIHVLVVEDHDDSREVWRRVLDHCGAL